MSSKCVFFIKYPVSLHHFVKQEERTKILPVPGEKSFPSRGLDQERSLLASVLSRARSVFPEPLLEATLTLFSLQVVVTQQAGLNLV